LSLKYNLPFKNIITILDISIASRDFLDKFQDYIYSALKITQPNTCYFIIIRSKDFVIFNQEFSSDTDIPKLIKDISYIWYKSSFSDGELNQDINLSLFSSFPARETDSSALDSSNDGGSTLSSEDFNFL
jgi:hypothetical protein